MTTRQASSGGAPEQGRKLDTAHIKAGEAPPVALKAKNVSQKNGWTIKSPEEWRTLADKLDFVCAQLGCPAPEREPLFDEDNPDQQVGVRLTVKLDDGTSVGGKGKTTAEAAEALFKRLNQFGVIKLEGA